MSDLAKSFRKGKLKVEAGSVPAISIKLPEGKNSVDGALGFVRDYRSA